MKQGSLLALALRWSLATWNYMMSLASSGDVAAMTGAQFVSGFKVTADAEFEDPWYKDDVLGYRRLTEPELQAVFPTARQGAFWTSLLVNTQKYLPWLMQRFKDAGGKIECRTVGHLSEVAEHCDVVVNCCGGRAKQLVGDTHTTPIRGQTIRVSAPWVKHFYVFESVKSDMPSTYILPLGAEILLGGVAQRGQYSEQVDQADREDIWMRITTHFPFVKGAPITREWAGLRPGRSTVRLEVDSCSVKGRTVPVVHNYGHGGSGVTLHWGCAADAADLVRTLLVPPASPSMPSKL